MGSVSEGNERAEIWVVCLRVESGAELGSVSEKSEWAEIWAVCLRVAGGHRYGQCV